MAFLTAVSLNTGHVFAAGVPTPSDGRLAISGDCFDLGTGDTDCIDDQAADADTVPTWTDSDGSDTDAAIRDEELRLRSLDMVTRSGISTANRTNINLEYFWGYDTDDDGSDDGDLVVQWKTSASGTWITLNTHDLPNNADTCSGSGAARCANSDDNVAEVALGLTACNTTIDIRFWGDTDEDNDQAFVDNVVLSGDPDADADCTADADEPVDTDGDTVPDNVDNCDNTANLNQSDVDGDGIGDLCDTETGVAGVGDCGDTFDNDGDGQVDGADTGCAADTDGDTVPDNVDNCDNTANLNQSDVDGDGIGDLCDTETGVAGVGDCGDTFDNDGDGQVDGADSGCIAGTTTPLVPAACASMTFDRTIVGTEGNDTIVGTGLRELIFGLGGNDTILGGAGNDCIVGGEGNDRLEGGSGNDKLLGEGGLDALKGDSGTDSANGGASSDSCDAESETACES